LVQLKLTLVAVVAVEVRAVGVLGLVVCVTTLLSCEAPPPPPTAKTRYSWSVASVTAVSWYDVALSAKPVAIVVQVEPSSSDRSTL
jgi:hypothetical protein